MTIPEDIKQKIDNDAEDIYIKWARTGDHNHRTISIRLAEYGYSLAQSELESKDKEIGELRKLLRMTDCPEILIENPGLLFGGEPTWEDIDWAMKIIEKHQNISSNEQ